ncbi:hypothetical protein Pst134EB_018447 [Puccinia striiformis f. sp. tritici]|uniref:DDE Tnp4 domain-containing protein n=1 Tax=Puccinia striiformis f. sp. tritici PST-78 TaxID=1165861 RepID=A0A0L0V7T1_9BASI|nr:hypothetical protein Pst134EB_018447 [Puccinia striiformis f. sp. tritici]KNE95029.1 hypothetical protein PSTG_11626 [Puccinia striiformis f. sp. tritici PST-78]
MLRPYVYGYLQQQQEEFQGSLQRRRTHIEALNRSLDEQLSQSAADMDREEEEAIALIITLGHLGTPGLFRQIRTYLTRADLPVDPMKNSAWAFLWSARNDRGFITTMGVDVTTFDNLLQRYTVHWDFSTIDREDVNPHGEPQIGRRTLDAAGSLGLVLHWISSTMSAYTLQQLFGITPAVCSRYLATGTKHLLTVLKEHPEARFLWPTTERKAQQYSAPIEKKFPLLKKCFGFLDGLNLPILVSGDEDVQNAYYNGWTCSHYCSSILAFAPDGTIMFAILNAPGSWHDSIIAEPLYDQLLERTPPGYRLISDTAFPRKTERLQSRILAPVKRGDRLPSSPRSYARLKVLNDSLVSARQAAEWGMRSIQGSFARLKLPLPAEDNEYRADLLQLVCRLHQIRCRLVGINQTASVYESVWDENAVLCRDFHNMLFKDIESRCHISRYYDAWL